MVIWSAPAKADLRSIHDFIATDSRHYAKKVVQDLIEKTDVLDRLPRIGRIVPELGDDNICELLPYSYRVIFEIKGEVSAYERPPLTFCGSNASVSSMVSASGSSLKTCRR